MRRCRKWSESRRFTQPITMIVTAFSVLAAGSACGGEPPRARIPLSDRTPKVLLIGIDGVRPDILAEVPTPNLDALASGGFFTARTRTTTPSLSGPAWASMLTGVWPEKHGVTDNDFTGRRYERFPDFLTRIEQLRPELTTFAVVDWLPLVQIDGGGPTISDRIDVKETLDGSELGWAVADTRSVGLAVQKISRGDPDAMFVYLGNPDETSHEYESIGAEYRDAIALSDRHVGMLIDAIRARPRYPSENWLILIGTDHGRRTDGGHGGETPVELTTFTLVSGPAAALGAPIDPTFIVDLGVTALAHLGIPIDPAWQLDGSPVGLR
jgi:arylsulfatase A-like enzyme